MFLVNAAYAFAVVFIAVGILGFVPAAAPNDMLFGIFHVNDAHNVVHLISGAVALGAAMSGPIASRRYFQIFGVIYGLVAVMGLVMGEGYLLGLISNNMPDVWLHVAIAAVSLALGFAVQPTGVNTADVAAGTAQRTNATAGMRR